MAEKVPDSISIPDKILQTLFSSLENQAGFDNEMISQLRALAERNELTKVENVTAVLKKEKGENDETH
jgi:hypothetical protein